MTFQELKEKAHNLPQQPGVYIMMDKSGDIIYVGKAKSLRSRVSDYFRENGHDPKTALLVSRIFSFDIIVTVSEFDALVAENSLIKHHKPKYNILLKDDKGYPYARLDEKEEYPRFSIVSKPQKDGARYLGPYGSRTILRNAINAVQKALRLPSCSRKFPNDLNKERPCLNFHMGICSGYCQGTPNSSEYRKMINEAVMLLEGKTEQLCRELTQRMEEAAESLQFEYAAELRDRINSLKRLSSKHIAISGASVDTDAVGFYRGTVKSCFVVMHYIEGKLLDKDYEILDNPMEDDGEAISALLRQYYMSRGTCPKNILLPVHLPDLEALERLFSETFGKKVKLLVPQKGEKFRLVSGANINAREETARATNREERVSKTLEWLQKALKLEKPPVRIEAYDISNTGNDDIAGSMTVFERGRPLKRDYRRIKIKSVEKQDDYHSMQEILTRRFQNYLDGDGKFRELPDLLLVDGGHTHASMARETINSMGIELPVFGMVKDDRHRTRALISPEGEEIGIGGNQSVFSLIGRIQEETHRFAIEYHRNMRSKKAKGSVLDRIEGIGEVRKKLLLKEFKSIKAIRSASYEELSQVLPKNAARAVYEYFRQKNTAEKAKQS